MLLIPVWRQEHLWESPASQPSLLGEFQAGERTYFKTTTVTNKQLYSRKPNQTPSQNNMVRHLKKIPVVTSGLHTNLYTHGCPHL